jgi:sucrose phosphorylase
MFLSFNKLSPDGKISEKDLAKVYTRKPRPPYSIIARADGTKEKIWSTFDHEQIDLDWESDVTRRIMRNCLIGLAREKVKVIRMDAFAYTTIRIGTRCFFLEPDVWKLLEWLDGCVAPFNVGILPEVHETHAYQLKLSKQGYWVYDFALPMLVLHTLYHHTNRRLVAWLRICPHKQFTTLDTHDGIGVVDVQGLMSQPEIDRTVDGLYAKGSNAKRRYSSAEFNNLDIYQMNTTYYSALECNDAAYICARIIQFFTPGIPQLYYVGLLAGKNDIEQVEKTKSGRSINRHNYSLEEIDVALQKTVVQRLLQLMQFRSSYPAFDGDFTIGDTPEHELVLEWRSGAYRATAKLNLEDYRHQIVYYDEKAKKNRELRF